MMAGTARASGPHKSLRLPLPLKLAVALLLLCGILGGSSQPGLVLHEVVILAALGLIAFVVVKRPDRLRGGLVPIVLTLLVAAPLLQLIPLPPEVWTGLSGRGFAAQIAASVDPHGWLPVSLDAPATQLSLLSLSVPIASFLLTRGMGEPGRARHEGIALLWCIVLVGCFSALLGLAQLGTHALYPYTSLHNGLPVGIFANRNHQAALMAITLAVTLLLAVRQLRSRQLASLAWPHVPVMLLVVTVAMLTQSRAGALLMCMAVVPALLMLQRNVSRWVALAAAGTLIAAAAWLALSDSGQGIVTRLAGAGSDERFVTLNDVWFMVTYNFPIGTGLGTFARAFLPVESLTSIAETYLNHAHCEYLEILAECGLMGALAILATLGLVGYAMLQVIGIIQQKPSSDEAFVNLAAITILVILLTHSIVDYPMRTFAIAAIAGAAAGLLTRQRRQEHTEAPEQGAPASRPASVLLGAGRMLILILVAAGMIQTVRLALSLTFMSGNEAPRLFGPALTTDAFALEAEEARQRGDNALAARQAVEALRVSPYNFDALRILGEVAMAQGEAKKAAQFLALSARVTWRNSDVQSWQMRQSLHDGDVVAAINAGDALLRRDRDADEVFQAFTSIAVNPGIRAPLVERLAESPPWAQAFMAALINVPTEYQPQIQGFLIEAMKQHFRPDDSRWQSYFESALQDGQAAPIIQMSRLANPGVPIDPRGGAVDADFGAIAANRVLWGPFGWKLHDPNAYFDDGQANGQIHDLHISRTGGGQVLTQHMLLPPGRYTLSGSAGTTDESADLALWEIECQADRKQIAEVPLEGAKAAQFAQTFVVPANCPDQILSLKIIPGMADSDISLGSIHVRRIGE